jgi:ribonuclease HI
MKFIIFSDGGARGNPGPAGIGFVIKDEDENILYKEGRCIGETTNNQAEYQAIVAALEKAAEMKGDDLHCFLDSELVVKQLNGEYKVKDPGLAQQYMKIWNLKNKFKSVKYEHVYREQNKLADSLVNEALDA